MDELLMVGGDEDHQGSSKPKSHVSLYYAGWIHAPLTFPILTIVSNIKYKLLKIPSSILISSYFRAKNILFTKLDFITGLMLPKFTLLVHARAQRSTRSCMYSNQWYVSRSGGIGNVLARSDPSPHPELLYGPGTTTVIASLTSSKLFLSSYVVSHPWAP